eukprot:gene31209-40572_t
MEDLDGEKVVDLEFIAKNILVCLPDTSNSVDVFAHTIENVANYPSFSNEPNEIVDVVSTAVDESDENLVVESDSDEDDEIKLKPMMADCLTAEEESSGPSGLPRTRNEIINRDDDIRLTEISACVANMPGLKIDRKGDIFVLRAEVGGISTYSSSFSEVGLVMNYVEHEKSVIVKSNTGQTNSLPLNEDSLVCIKPNRNGVNADFMVLGKVSEVFGPVTAPFYLVKLARSAPVEDSSETSLGPVADHGRNQHTKPGTTRKHIRSRKNKGSNVVESTSTVVADVPSVPSPQQPVLSALEWIQGYSDDEDEDESAQPSSRDLSQSESLTTPASSTISKTADGGDEACVPWPGSLVFAVAGQCQYLTAAILMTMRVKGSDASNIYDEEPDDSEVEFSDDEKEMAAKLSRKNKGGTTLPPSAPLQQQRQQQHHHRPTAAARSAATVQYDDDAWSSPAPASTISAAVSATAPFKSSHSNGI